MSSWYIELAAEEGLDPRLVVIALAKALLEKKQEDAVTVHTAKRIDLQRPLLTVRQVATLLSRDEETIRRYARKRILTSVDIPGGAILFDEKILLDELNGYIRPSKFSD